MPVATVLCEYCQCDLSSGQRFRLAGRIVCAACAQAQVSAPAVETAEEADTGFDALTAAVSASSSASSRRASVVRKPVKRKSSMSVGLIAFAVATVALCGASLYVVQSGKLKGWMGPSPEHVAVEAENNVIKQYNTLVAEGNELAKTRDYAKAIEKFRQAHAVASALPAVKKSVDLVALDGVIARYQSLMQGKPQPAIASPTPKPAPAPQNLQFMEAPAPALSTNTPEATPPSPAPSPKRLFDDPPAQTAAKPPQHKPKDKDKDKEEPSRIDAYKKP